MMRCLVIDDEPLAREGIAEYILGIEYLQLVDLCSSAIEALNILESKKIDLMFLDIQMPKLNGLDFLRSLKNPPLTILTTAFPSFALEGYDLNVLDYLVKPVTLPRFLKSIEKAKNQFDLLNHTTAESKTEEEFFFVKTDSKFEKIRIKNIQFIESMQNYIKIVCQDKSYVSLLPLKSIKANLPISSFLQSHKSYLVNINQIEALEGMLLTVGGNKIPISRTYKQEVYDRVVKNNLLGRG